MAEPKQTLLGTTELFLTGDFDIQFCEGILSAGSEYLPKEGKEAKSSSSKVVKCAFGRERKRNELIAICTWEY
jgi:hypothetical protein